MENAGRVQRAVGKRRQGTQIATKAKHGRGGKETKGKRRRTEKVGGDNKIQRIHEGKIGQQVNEMGWGAENTRVRWNKMEHYQANFRKKKDLFRIHRRSQEKGNRRPWKPSLKSKKRFFQNAERTKTGLVKQVAQMSVSVQQGQPIQNHRGKEEGTVFLRLFGHGLQWRNWWRKETCKGKLKGFVNQNLFSPRKQENRPSVVGFLRIV